MMEVVDIEKEQKAFLNDVYYKYQNVMLRIAKSYIDDSRICEDMVQNAFLSLLRNKKVVMKLPAPKLKAYIILATRHACIDYLRKERRMNLLDIPDNILLEMVDKSRARLSESDMPFRTVEFYSVIHQLPAEDQTILLGHYIAGLDTEELAHMLGCSPNTLRVRLHRARKRALALFQTLGLRMEDFF